jgi:hypothetical protein
MSDSEGCEEVPKVTSKGTSGVTVSLHLPGMVTLIARLMFNRKQQMFRNEYLSTLALVWDCMTAQIQCVPVVKKYERYHGTLYHCKRVLIMDILRV